MYSSHPRRESGRDSKHQKRSNKEKRLANLIASDSDTEGENEHELSFYMNDRVKMMKEVLKIIKPRKIKSMAPDCMKNMDLQEINSMLLEELLGISNKRLKYIFEGKILDDESSTDEDQPVDVISLDDISDDDFVVISDDDSPKKKDKHKRKKIKEEPREKSKKIKKEKPDKERSSNKTKEIEKVKEKIRTTRKVNPEDKETIGEENLMSVLELLELQARARAIRSQLELENKRKLEEQQQKNEEKKKLQDNQQEDDDEVIMEVPKDVEIIITSSESEHEDEKAASNETGHSTQNSQVSPKTTSNHADNVTIVERNDESSQNTSLNGVKVSQTSENQGESSDIRNSNSGEGKNKKKSQQSGDNDTDKEEGEVSDSETPQIDSQAKEKEVEKSANTSYENKEENSNESDSESSSNDNLQLIKERETQKKIRMLRKKNSSKTSSNNIEKPSNSENIEEENESQNTPTLEKSTELEKENPQINGEENSYTRQAKNQVENFPKTDNLQTEIDQPKSSKIEAVIEEFMKTQPPPPDNTEDLLRLEEEKELKAKRGKEKRIKSLKNKLQSFKQDVAVETQTQSITVLENIVIKPKSIGNRDSRERHLEHSDDLVINVDQDDIDCMVLD